MFSTLGSVFPRRSSFLDRQLLLISDSNSGWELSSMFSVFLSCVYLMLLLTSMSQPKINVVVFSQIFEVLLFALTTRLLPTKATVLDNRWPKYSNSIQSLKCMRNDVFKCLKTDALTLPLAAAAAEKRVRPIQLTSIEWIERTTDSAFSSASASISPFNVRKVKSERQRITDDDDDGKMWTWNVEVISASTRYSPLLPTTF